MFGIGTGEILVILLVALLVLGPKEIPKVARTIGKTLKDIHRFKDELRQSVDTEFEQYENKEISKVDNKDEKKEDNKISWFFDALPYSAYPNHMSHLVEPRPVKIIFSVIFNRSADISLLKKKIDEQFGEIDYESEKIDFDKTNYYTREMGTNLCRKIFSKKQILKRDEIVEIKIKTNQIEEQTSLNNKRIFNIDPGYLAEEHFVLSTGKGYAHRPYLGKGVYADLTLIYKDKRFNELEWTYPDYKTLVIQNMLKEIRKIYLDNLREEKIYD